jgi:hypothetical protein
MLILPAEKHKPFNYKYSALSPSLISVREIKEAHTTNL